MMNAKECILKIKETLADYNPDSDELVKQIALDFGNFCKDVNSSIQKCISFLEQNMRTDALQFAETSPSLFDRFDLANFDEFDDWRRVAASRNECSR